MFQNAMKTEAIFTVLLMICLCGCAAQDAQPTDGSTPGLLSQVPTGTRTFRGNYSGLATCAYQHLSAKEAGLQKADLPEAKTINLSLSSGGVKYWSIDFKPASPKETIVTITTASTLIGPFPGTEKIMSEIEDCSSSTSRGGA